MADSGWRMADGGLTAKIELRISFIWGFRLSLAIRLFTVGSKAIDLFAAVVAVAKLSSYRIRNYHFCFPNFLAYTSK